MAGARTRDPRRRAELVPGWRGRVDEVYEVHHRVADGAEHNHFGDDLRAEAALGKRHITPRLVRPAPCGSPGCGPAARSATRSGASARSSRGREWTSCRACALRHRRAESRVAAPARRRRAAHSRMKVRHTGITMIAQLKFSMPPNICGQPRASAGRRCSAHVTLAKGAHWLRRSP
jgi:hypothetical protein